MKKSLVILFVLIIAALSVMSVSADQDGNSCWCNTDSYGCWITGENGGHDYIMFWSESARESIMGPDSDAPIGDMYISSELPLKAPVVVKAAVQKKEPSAIVPTRPTTGGDPK